MINPRLRRRLAMVPSRLIFLAMIFIYATDYTAAQGQKSPYLPDHPRLIFQKADEDELLNYISGDNYVAELHRVIIETSDAMLDSKPVIYEKTGKRLLQISRTCLKRVLYLSYSYRITNEVKYLIRAEKEMISAANFRDWNPDHFLDVAEMTSALAFGYDWLYHGLSAESRTIIENAIINKGLIPSKNSDYNTWLGRKNNWNQVCNGGLTLGAIAIYESDPVLAQEIIDRARISLKIPEHEYEPDGAYPEGNTYWAYGTMFHVLWIDAIREAFGEEAHLDIGRGFMKSGYFFLHIFGPNGSFNYSDCRSDVEYTPTIFWFSKELGDNTMLYHQKKLLDDLMCTKTFKTGKISHDRFLPMIPVWASKFKSLDFNDPKENSWTGKGHNPVSFHRTSWKDDGIFIGIKGGSPSLSHAHMDIGSFVMDANGVRWAMDMGKHDYYKLESTGMDIWNRAQDSERWTILRYNNLLHNTLSVNHELQQVEGHGTIIKYSDNDQFRSTVLDISSAYKGQLKSAFRGIAIADNNYVIVRDEIVNEVQSGTVRWAMLTHDNIEIIDDHTAIIRKDDKELKFLIVEPQNAKIQFYSTKPRNEFEDDNPGTAMIGFEVDLKPDEEQVLIINLLPGDIELPERIFTGKLSRW